MKNRITDLSHKDLIKEATRRAHNGLLEKGGQGLEIEMYSIFNLFDQWLKAQEKKDAKKQK